MLKVYVIRHGQSTSNRDNTFGSQLQVELTELGRAEAMAARELIPDIPFDRVYSSDLIRARQTAALALPGCDPIIRPLLREISTGAFQGHSVDECIAKYGEHYYDIRSRHDFTSVGGENLHLHCVRTAEFMRELESLSDLKNIIVFTHAGTVRCMLSYILGIELPPQRLACVNASMSVFSYDSELSRGAWRLEAWNIAPKL